MSKSKTYTNGEVTIVWKPDLCIHSANCVSGLPAVFDTEKKPWINADGAATEAIIEQVKKCPSGALSTYINKEKVEAAAQEKTKVTLAKNGPLIVQGSIDLKDADGSIITTGSSCALCRCGGSSNKPFCDGTHNKIGFSG